MENTGILTKDDFIYVMESIIEQQEKIDKFNDALKKVCDGYPVFDSNNKYLSALLFTLSKMFGQIPNDQLNAIDWYLFDCGGHEKDHLTILERNGKTYEVNINNLEMLYDYLIAEKQDIDNNTDEYTTAFYKTNQI